MEMGDVGDSGVTTREAAVCAVRCCERGTATDGGESLGGSVLQRVRHAPEEENPEIQGREGQILPTEPSWGARNPEKFDEPCWADNVLLKGSGLRERGAVSSR